MAFFVVKERGNDKKRYTLKVVKGDITVTPLFNLTMTDLNKDKNGYLYKHFFNNGSSGITFKITVIFKHTDIEIMDKINDWLLNSTPLYISTEAIDIPTEKLKDYYIITKNNSRKQSNKYYTEWELEFTTYKGLTVHKFKNDNTAVKNALKKSKKSGGKTSNKKSAKSNTALINNLSNCDQKKSFVYSKTKKDVKCVRYLQKFLQSNSLYLNGKIDGWFGPLTKDALKKYQKKKKLKQTGTMTNETFKSIIGNPVLGTYKLDSKGNWIKV